MDLCHAKETRVMISGPTVACEAGDSRETTGQGVQGLPQGCEGQYSTLHWGTRLFPTEVRCRAEEAPVVPGWGGYLGGGGSSRKLGSVLTGGLETCTLIGETKTRAHTCIKLGTGHSYVLPFPNVSWPLGDQETIQPRPAFWVSWLGNRFVIIALNCGGGDRTPCAQPWTWSGGGCLLSVSLGQQLGLCAAQGWAGALELLVNSACVRRLQDCPVRMQLLPGSPPGWDTPCV